MLYTKLYVPAAKVAEYGFETKLFDKYKLHTSPDKHPDPVVVVAVP